MTEKNFLNIKIIYCLKIIVKIREKIIIAVSCLLLWCTYVLFGIEK